MNETTGWWSRRPAADESLDASDDWWSRREDADDAWLDDFDFDDVADAEPTDKVGSIWSRYGTRTDDPTLRLVSAQRLVQGFVDTFATGDRRYVVTFDESIKTAGTDFRGRAIKVSHRPLFDRTLTAEQAETILTAMAVHESAHVRYGARSWSAAIAKLAATEPLAPRVSNVLADVHDERLFVADYPGFADVFAPAIDYVVRDVRASLGGALVDPARLSGEQLMIAAVRYPAHVDWSDETYAAEREWFTDWSIRGTRTSRAADHVAAVREGIEHIKAADEQREQPEPEPEPSDATGEQEQHGSSPGGEGQDEQQQSAPAPQQAAPSEFDDVELPECFADAIDAIAAQHGGSVYSASRAQEMVRDGQALTDPFDSHGRRGEVYWSHDGIARSRQDIDRPAGASAAIRNAFARSRTGHYAVQNGLRSGRLANRSLDRIASDDYRLFSRRRAQSEGRYLVWLLVDCSGSMNGYPIRQASGVAYALAAATRHLPNVRLDIWGWSSPFKIRTGAAVFGAVRVYADGDPLSNVAYLPSVPSNGTPDAELIRWAGRAIKDQLRPGERGVLIVASDGEGSLARSQNERVVADVRKGGVEVLSVAIGHLREDFQRSRYGDQGYVPWAGSIAATAGPLGRIIARIASRVR